MVNQENKQKAGKIHGIITRLERYGIFSAGRQSAA
jgi:hypothetical protein